ncbi:cytochrome c1 [Vibrio mangrovi]|uniref:Cytochrome b/c1 n=1 Tax=Vibrio mangrovi TaxID=474394 RepID=A0A1Y6IRC8_9VIBR|nr:cytochrome c1 [Vibrio mangrovi]MDW6001755.1 cytochrome c1 [Vibrio mangrovi]SMS00219.1 Cytochrome b/c1 [Vibrio mangrovi]
MKKGAAGLLLIVSFFSLASENQLYFEPISMNSSDPDSLRRGVKLYSDYCLGCHGLQYQRYGRIKQDLKLTEPQMIKYFGPDFKNSDVIDGTISEKAGRKWFGVSPPDLTLVTRLRGDSWVYNYLRAFYVDPSRPFGVNNFIYPQTSMPHVLEPLQGMPSPVYEQLFSNGEEKIIVTGTSSGGSGKLSPKEYDRAIQDLVHFLDYVSEPSKLERRSLGWWVIGFLLLLTMIVWALKKEYWRDVH